MNRQILRLATPNIISNITVPLLGMIDIAIAGHLSSVLYIGAISLGTSIFNMIYWNFSFLRMGTSGFAAQAYGARDFTEMINTLIRSLMVALGIGLIIILLQIPIFSLANLFIHTSNETIDYIGKYFFIVVWSAPAMLSMYAFNGWFIGMQNAKTPMYIAIGNNVLNILLSFTFVFYLNMSIAGIALGTMLSQFATFLATFVIWYRNYGKKMQKYLNWSVALQKDTFKHFFKVNSDIFIRTFLLVSVTTFFTFASSGMGDTVLAANALLMQFFMLFSYFMDGFAYAGEALTGKFIGAKQRHQLKKLVRNLMVWGVGIAIAASIIYFFFTPTIFRILTDKQTIISVASDYAIWTMLIPFAGFATFIWDGIYVGATASGAMRNSMIVAAAVFFLSYFLVAPWYGNNGLWLSFILYLFFRGFTQTIWSKKIITYKASA